MQPHWPYHMHVQNDMETELSGLNLLSVWEAVEPPQQDIATLEPGASIEFKCTDPNPHLFRRRFKAAVEAAGGTFPEVWYCEVEELEIEE